MMPFSCGAPAEAQRRSLSRPSDAGISGWTPKSKVLPAFSPSILREFLTYSVIGLTPNQVSLVRRADEIATHIKEVSRAKLELAKNVFSAVLNRFENDALIKEQACILIAGDIVYEMAHDAPRPERSTGKLVKGSDMDLVVVVDDLFPKELVKRMDEMIYREKQRILSAPHLREEVDYVVKDLARVREQMGFDTFKHMVACKILQESTLLFGEQDLFGTIKSMLLEHGITEKLTAGWKSTPRSSEGMPKQRS